MAKKRERSDIVLDMLKAIQDRGGRIKPTHLMYRANLSYKQFKSYLEELLEKNLVEKIKEKHYEYIIITEPGLKFLHNLRQMKEFERTFGL